MITDEHLGELNDIINRAREHVECFNEFEISFLADWECKLSLRGNFVVVSDKQSFVFEKIYRKLSHIGKTETFYSLDDAGDCSYYSNAFNLCSESSRVRIVGQE